MAKPHILISEKIAEEGVTGLMAQADVDYLPNITREELLDVIKNYDALVVRSATKVNEELYKAAGPRLKVVGRAGNGVDNIDIPVSSRYGVIVVNTPDSNTISACEQTIGLMIASCRNIPWAHNTIRQGIWDRSPFRGMELFGKTLGIVGLGRIGSMVATRMKAFNMTVIAYDPYIPDERFKRLDVERVNSMDEIARRSDVITIHTPKTPETMGMMDEAFFEKCKDGVRIVNCARGGLIKESAILAGMKSGKIASAGIDTHEHEPIEKDDPLFQFEKVVMTPHLGADTNEAQKRVGEDIAKQVLTALSGELVPNVVNLPLILKEELEYLRPYVTLCENLGAIYAQLYKEPVDKVELTYSGPLCKKELEFLNVSFLKGLLTPALGDRVNYVNAKLMAEERDIQFNVNKEEESASHYANLITAVITTKNTTMKVCGTLNQMEKPMLVEIDGIQTECEMSGNILMLRNIDRPGMIGFVATVLGEAGINIADMRVARDDEMRTALMLIRIDGEMNDNTLVGVGKINGLIAVPKLLKF